MKKNKKKMFLLFVFFPLLIALGISTWIIVTYDSTQPKYNANSQYFIDYNGKTGVYSGEQQGPTSDSGNLVDLSNVKFKHRLISDSINNYDDGLPIDAGEYFIYIESTTDSSLSTDIYFKIEPFKFRVGVIEQDYSSSTRNWSDIRDGFNSDKVKFYEEDGITELTNLPSDYSDYININNLDITITDGVNEFNSSPSGNLIGSTYLLEYFMPNTKNYAVYDVKTDSYNSRYDANTEEYIGSTFFKYNTVKTTINNTSNTYCTIEDALIKGTGTIALCGDETNNSSYVQTSFTSLNYAYNTLTYELNGRNLIVPADSSNTELIGKDVSLSNIVYSVLKIPFGINLNVINNGKICVSAFIGTNTIVGRRGIIMNDGTIDVISGEIRSYGYIKSSSQNSNGIIKFQSGTTAIDCMTIHDYPGGNTTSKLNGKTLPISAWTIHNISCKTEIIGKAKYKVHVRQEAASSVVIDDVFSIINDSNPLFVCNDSISKITKVSKNKINDTSLYSITGLNQIKEQRDELIIEGNYTDSIFKISYSGVTMSTGTSSVCPIGYLDITVNSGTLNLQNSDYLFYPDTYLRINENATLYVGNEVDVSFERIQNLKYVADTDSSYVSQLFSTIHTCVEDAKLYLSGKINFHSNGRIGGQIVPEKSNVTLDLSSLSRLYTTFYGKQHAVGTTGSGSIAYQNNNHPISGIITNSTESIIDNTLCTFKKSTYNSIDINGTICWFGERGAEYSISIKTGAVNQESCIVSGTLITLADGSKKPVDDITYDDEILVFNHETGKWDVSRMLFITHEDEGFKEYETITLHFSNNYSITIVAEHGFYDMDLMRYVFINKNNIDSFIGHKFYSAELVNNELDIDYIELLSYEIKYEYTKIYCPVTAYHMNSFNNGLLAMPNFPYGAEGLVNIFEYDDDLKFNEEKMKADIEKYGIFEYEYFKDYFSYEAYLASPAVYLKVSIGKGYLTHEQMMLVIEYLLTGDLIE